MVKKTTESAAVATRAEKKDATKKLIREILVNKEYKHNDLIEEVSKSYTQRFGGEETENVNDVKGRVGSVLDIMKKDGDILYDSGVYALKQEMPKTDVVKEPMKKAPKRTTKKTDVAEKADTETNKIEITGAPEKVAKKPVKKTVKAKAEAEKSENEQKEPLKKRGRKPKQSVEAEKVIPQKKENTVVEVKSERTEKEPTVSETKEKVPESPTVSVLKTEKTDESAATETGRGSETKSETALTIKEKGEVSPKGVVMDMSFLLGGTKSKAQVSTSENREAKKELVREETAAKSSVRSDAEIRSEVRKSVEKAESAEKPQEKMQEKQQEKSDRTQLRENLRKDVQAKTDVAHTEEPLKTEPVKTDVVSQKTRLQGTLASRRKENKPMTEDEKLREKFLGRLRALGGDYFEYYSVYLLEKYSRKNGRRLEALRVCGGDYDGGIDGEIELTDRFGFRETIYIQSKNWNPDRGDEKLWVVGETLLQQFIGACACRKAKDGKQNTRGIFITTSRFTPEAKRILEQMSDTIVGYDGAELYETAKECSFGLVQKNGVWHLDEKLLSGTKAFFTTL